MLLAVADAYVATGHKRHATLVDAHADHTVLALNTQGFLSFPMPSLKQSRTSVLDAIVTMVLRFKRLPRLWTNEVRSALLRSRGIGGWYMSCFASEVLKKQQLWFRKQPTPTRITFSVRPRSRLPFVVAVGSPCGERSWSACARRGRTPMRRTRLLHTSSSRALDWASRARAVQVIGRSLQSLMSNARVVCM